MNTMTTQAALPWYRERWPWLLMAGPVAAVIGGLITAWLAVTHEDGLVADDYYKQGLAINRTLDREQKAAAFGVEARLMFSADGTRVRAMVQGRQATPDRLTLRFTHATRAGLDQTVALARDPGGWYEGGLAAIRTGKWKVLLEDPAAGWRVSGVWQADADDGLELGAQVH